MADDGTATMTKRTGALAVMLTGLASLGVYLATLAPAVPVGDSGELISVAYVAGVAHPPGYPLYTMIGWVATHIWPGSPAVAMNLLSAVFHAATVCLVTILTARVVAPRWPKDGDSASATVGGIAGALALAVSSVFWLYSLVAEVFALNNLFAAALLLLAVEWYRDRSRTWALWTVGLLSGLATAHHQTIVLLAPALGVLLVAGLRADIAATRTGKRRTRPPRQVKASHFVVGAALIAVGLLPYLYLPVAAAADPPVNFGDPETVGRFVDVVSRGPYGSFSLIPGGERGSLAENAGLHASHLVGAFTPVGLAFVGVGAVHLWRRRRVEAWALLLAFLFTGVFFVAFANAPLVSAVTEGVVERFYMLSSVPYAVVLGAGVFASLLWLRERLGWSERRVVVTALLAILAAIGLLGVLRWSGVDQSENRVAETYAADVLARLEPDALLLSRGDHNFTTLTHAQVVDGMRPDVVLLDMELLKLDSHVAERRVSDPDVSIPFDAYEAERPEQIVELVAANLGRRPVYAVGSLPEISEAFDTLQHGLVTRVQPTGTGDRYSLLVADPSLVTDLRFPERDYPDKTWESILAEAYGRAAFSLAFALHEPDPTAADPSVVEYYDIAIELAQLPEAYKNLGLFFYQRGVERDRAVSLWETYLEINPDDPQADDIRTAIGQLRNG